MSTLSDDCVERKMFTRFEQYWVEYRTNSLVKSCNATATWNLQHLKPNLGILEEKPF